MRESANRMRQISYKQDPKICQTFILLASHPFYDLWDY